MICLKILSALKCFETKHSVFNSDVNAVERKTTFELGRHQFKMVSAS